MSRKVIDANTPAPSGNPKVITPTNIPELRNSKVITPIAATARSGDKVRLVPTGSAGGTIVTRAAATRAVRLSKGNLTIKEI